MVPTQYAAAARGKTSSAVEELGKLRESYNIANIERLVVQGKKAIWGGNSWETPLIYACDTIPVGMGELWREESRAAESVGENYFQIPPEFLWSRFLSRNWNALFSGLITANRLTMKNYGLRSIARISFLKKSELFLICG
ncbi:MAG: hypothetical protein A4E52_01534 [Pelotomaculum sp. PtaB.Bin013]|nr:MAG: hypothetical protein A4E52_01534 [Pelotomaculum sp. PtaB.Bin013]